MFSSDMDIARTNCMSVGQELEAQENELDRIKLNMIEKKKKNWKKKKNFVPQKLTLFVKNQQC